MHQVPNFIPSQNGLHYSNRWPNVPDITLKTPLGDVEIGHASGGLCGGMAFTVRDLFERGLLPDPSRQNPAPGTPSFQYLVDRLFQSFDLPWGVAKFYEWMGMDNQAKLAQWSIEKELPLIRDSIDHGKLCPIGLVRILSRNPKDLGENHQVVVWGYDETPAKMTLALYDPNWPNRDDVTISWNPALPYDKIQFTYLTGEPLFGFFPMHYSGQNPTPLASTPIVSRQPGDGQPPVA